MGPIITPHTEGHTANYGWIKPEVGASVDVWGDMLNQNFDAIDAKVHEVSGGGGGSLTIATEQVTVTGVNTFASLAHTPNMSLFILYIDGEAFFPLGPALAAPAADFSISGNAIIWLNTIYSAVPGSTVIAVYTWS
jgi:hypothetical protein